MCSGLEDNPKDKHIVWVWKLFYSYTNMHHTHHIHIHLLISCYGLFTQSALVVSSNSDHRLGWAWGWHWGRIPEDSPHEMVTPSTVAICSSTSISISSCILLGFFLKNLHGFNKVRLFEEWDRLSRHQLKPPSNWCRLIVRYVWFYVARFVWISKWT